MKKRIWELDAFRGLCVLGMIAVHLIYDLVDLYQLIQWDYPKSFRFLMDWGGVLFLVLSGVCVTLGSRCIRRGLTVLMSGMICTGVTWGMYALDFAGEDMIIWFGVLHCLGCCMLLWPVFRKLPHWALALLGIGIILLGLWIHEEIRVDSPWLIPLGVMFSGFNTPDYFPLLPHLGFFLLGSAVGKSLYAKKTTLLPRVDENLPPIRFLRWVGVWALPIYLLHQPLLALILYLLG